MEVTCFTIAESEKVKRDSDTTGNRLAHDRKNPGVHLTYRVTKHINILGVVASEQNGLALRTQALAHLKLRGWDSP
jgi:hypothetical protein